METYIILANYTQQGLANIKESPARIEAAKAATERAGGEWLGWWLTSGRYDFVVMANAPDGATAATIVLAISMGGNIRTETMRAYSTEEFAGIVANLP
jgi:uncharacterized protein with GYD domain